MTKNNQYILFAHCTLPHGIKGEFSFRLLNEESRFLEKGSTIYIQKQNKNETLAELKNDDKNLIAKKITDIRYGNKTIVKLEDVLDRNAVEALVPFDVYVCEDDLPELNDDEVYLSDLIDLEVIDASNQKSIGRVIDFYETSVQVVLVIKLASREIIEILYIDQFIEEVSLEDSKIYVHLPQIVE